MKINGHWITNPFFIYCLSWTLALIIYELGWSNLFPDISINLLLFLFFTIVIAGSIGLLLQLKKYIYYKPIENINKKALKYNFIFLYLLLFIEFFAARSIPLLGYITGNITVQYVDFGLPIVHVIVVNGFSYMFLYLFHAYISDIKDVNKNYFRITLFLSLLPALLFVNRAIIMYSILGAFFIYLMSRQKIRKPILITCLLGLLVIFLFGYLGNMRTKNYNQGNVILNLGKATEEFKNSYIPSEFFWTYLYIASPLSNMQTTIDYNLTLQHVYDENDLKSLIVNNMMPQLISKRLNIPQRAPYWKIEIFNVGTAYSQPFTTFGWWGLTFMFLFIIFFIITNLLFVSPKSSHFVTMLVIINIIVFFNIFDNMFVFLGLVPQLLIPIFLNLKSRFKLKYK